MQHQTPQFIDIEDKVVGPFTVKQFIYLIAGGGAAFLLFRFLPFFLFLVVATPIVSLFLALAFYKHNERPFVHLVESVFKYLVNTRLYLWRHRKPTDVAREQASVQAPQKTKVVNSGAGMGSSKLKDLSWNLEVKKEDLS